MNIYDKYIKALWTALFDLRDRRSVTYTVCTNTACSHDRIGYSPTAAPPGAGDGLGMTSYVGTKVGYAFEVVVGL